MEVKQKVKGDVAKQRGAHLKSKFQQPVKVKESQLKVKVKASWSHEAMKFWFIRLKNYYLNQIS